jgi:hypothetical protein
MTQHDATRRAKALAFKAATFSSKDEEWAALVDALGGLHSTDAPELVPLYEELMDRFTALSKELEIP